MRRAAERVDMRVEMAQLANVADQPRRANGARDIDRRGASGGGRRRLDYLGWRRPVLKERARLGIDRLRVGAKTVVQLQDIAGVGPIERRKIAHKLT